MGNISWCITTNDENSQTTHLLETAEPVEMLTKSQISMSTDDTARASRPNGLNLGGDNNNIILNSDGVCLEDGHEANANENTRLSGVAVAGEDSIAQSGDCYQGHKDDQVSDLSYGVLMINTELHDPKARQAGGSKDQFVKLVQNNGDALPEDLSNNLYKNIKENAIEMNLSPEVPCQQSVTNEETNNNSKNNNKYNKYNKNNNNRKQRKVHKHTKQAKVATVVSEIASEYVFKNIKSGNETDAVQQAEKENELLKQKLKKLADKGTMIIDMKMLASSMQEHAGNGQDFVFRSLMKLKVMDEAVAQCVAREIVKDFPTK